MCCDTVLKLHLSLLHTLTKDDNMIFLCELSFVELFERLPSFIYIFSCFFWTWQKHSSNVFYNEFTTVMNVTLSAMHWGTCTCSSNDMQLEMHTWYAITCPRWHMKNVISIICAKHICYHSYYWWIQSQHSFPFCWCILQHWRWFCI